MRAAAVCAVAAAVLASAAQAAISPVFDKERAQAGETVTLILGQGSDDFRGPLKFALVAADVEASVADPSDSRLIEIGDIGSAGEFDVPERFPFTVPDVPAGDYVAVIWFRAADSGRWYDLAEGLSVALAIGPHQAIDGAAPATGVSDSDAAWFDRMGLLVAVFTIGLVVVGLVIFRSRRDQGATKAPQ